MSKMFFAIGVCAVCALIAPGVTGGNTNVRFAIDQPFHFGGRGYDAGVIAVRGVSAYTPSTAMLEVWVNGECLGMMPARRSAPTGPSSPSEALFTRDAAGRLELTGFQLDGRPKGTLYRFP